MANKKSVTYGSTAKFRLNNMRGGLNTTAEETAYNTFDPNAQYGIGFETVAFEFKRLENWKPTYRGGQSKTFGYSLYCNTATTDVITGLYRYIKSDGTNQFIISHGTTVYRFDGTTKTSIGMTVANAFLHFETAFDSLIVSDGVGNPQKYDGTTVANLTTGADATAAAGAQQCIFHQNRLFLFSKTHDRSLVYYSDPGLIAQGYSTNFVQCDVNDGQKITAIYAFFIPGNLQPLIIVGKERSMGIIVGDGTDTNPYTFVKIAKDGGVASFRGIVEFEQDAAILSFNGIASYNGALQNQILSKKLLTSKIANQFTSLNPTNLPNALCWLDQNNRRFSYALPTGTNTYGDTIYHFDIDLGGWYTQTGFITTSAFVDTDGVVYTGDSTGKVYKHQSSVHNYNGSVIMATMETPYLDFFEPNYYKQIVSAKAVARGQGDYSFGISCSLDNGLGTGTSHTINLSGGNYTWGGGTWNSSGSYKWGTAPLVRELFFPGEMFENLSFTITNSGLNQPLDLLEILLEVEYLGLI